MLFEDYVRLRYTLGLLQYYTEQTLKSVENDDFLPALVWRRNCCINRVVFPKEIPVFKMTTSYLIFVLLLFDPVLYCGALKIGLLMPVTAPYPGFPSISTSGGAVTLATEEAQRRYGQVWMLSIYLFLSFFSFLLLA